MQYKVSGYNQIISNGILYGKPWYSYLCEYMSVHIKSVLHAVPQIIRQKTFWKRAHSSKKFLY